MKVLYLIGMIGYPARIGPIKQTLEVLEFASNNGVECDVIAFSWGADNDLNKLKKSLPAVNFIEIVNPLAGLSNIAMRLLAALQLRPPFFGSYASPRFKSIVSEAVSRKQYNLMHYFWFPAVSQYVCLEGSIPKIITMPDAQSLLNTESSKDYGFMRALTLKLAAYCYRRAEKSLLPHFERAIFVSRNDINYIQSFVPKAKCLYIPIFLTRDIYSHFIERPTANTMSNSLLIPRPSPKGLKWFLKKALPMIMREYPNLKITILSQQILGSWLEREIGVCRSILFRTWVDDFYAELIQHDAILMLDSSGTGMPNRTIAAMALGCTVIGTKESFRGIEHQDGEDCLIFETESQCRDQLSRVLDSADLRRAIGRTAALKMRDLYGYERVMSDTLLTYSEVTGLPVK